MKFIASPLAGAYLVEPEEIRDERGFFARSWCEREAAALDLSRRFVQCSISYNERRGTLRGLHYQAAPCQETKLVRCTQGTIYDVIVDLRPHSPTFRQHFGVSLSAQCRRSIYVPEGFAHGFMTLEDHTEVYYQISEFYSEAHARAVRWDDPAFSIQWPMEPSILSQRDRDWPDFIGAA